MNTQIASIGELMELWSKAAESAASQSHASGECLHSPREYIGFTERYEYCVTCDAKKVDGLWRSANGNQK